MQDFATAFILDTPGIASNQVKAMRRVAGKLLTPSRYGADYYQVIWSSKQHPQFHIGDHLSSLSATGRQPSVLTMDDCVLGRITHMLLGTSESRDRIQKALDARSEPRRGRSGQRSSKRASSAPPQRPQQDPQSTQQPAQQKSARKPSASAGNSKATTGLQ